jgi:hypothetical protein
MPHPTTTTLGNLASGSNRASVAKSRTLQPGRQSVWFPVTLCLLLLLLNTWTALAQKPAVEKIEPGVAGLNDDITLKVTNISGATEFNKLVLFFDGKPLKGIHPQEIKVDEPKPAAPTSATNANTSGTNTNTSTANPSTSGSNATTAQAKADDLKTVYLKFHLSRDEENADVWNQFLIKPRHEYRPTEASVGLEDEGPLAKGEKFNLRLYNKDNFRFVMIGFVLALAVFFYLAWKTNIIRDSEPQSPPEGKKRPFSLAKAQIAWWFFIIFGSFLLIRIVTDDYNTINQTGLVLLGIGTAAALGAAIVNSSKRESTDSELLTLKPKQATLQVAVKQLEAQAASLEAKKNASPPTISAQESETLAAVNRDLEGKRAELEQLNQKVADAESARNKPVSENFLQDILTDVNGVNLHRFQMIAWTITLGIIFLRSVYGKLAMPDFDDKILALMGISAGTYVAFKIPERQTDPNDSADSADTAGSSTSSASSNSSAASSETTNTSTDTSASSSNSASTSGSNTTDEASTSAGTGSASGEGADTADDNSTGSAGNASTDGDTATGNTGEDSTNPEGEERTDAG